MSDEHNPMRPLFVEVPSIGDDLRAVFEGMVAVAVDAAKPRPTASYRSPISSALAMLEQRMVPQIVGAKRVQSRRSPMPYGLEVEAQCPVCDKWVHIDVDERTIALRGLRDGLVYVLDTVERAVHAHVCDLELG